MTAQKIIYVTAAILSVLLTIGLSGCDNGEVAENEKFASPTPNPSLPPRTPR